MLASEITVGPLDGPVAGAITDGLGVRICCAADWPLSAGMVAISGMNKNKVVDKPPSRGLSG